MIFMITYRCNRSCSYCLVDASGPEAPHMPPEVFYQARELARLLKPKCIGLAGGEPFEHPEAEDWIEEARKGPWPLVRIATNGDRLLTDWRLRERLTGFPGVAIQVTAHDARSRKAWEKRLHEHKLPACVKGREPPTVFFPSAKARRALPEMMLDRVHFWMGGPLGRFCFSLRRLVWANITPLSLRDLLAAWHNAAAENPCTLHVHPDGTVRAGPWDGCQPLGTVEEALADLPAWERLVLERLNGPCLRCQPATNEAQSAA